LKENKIYHLEKRFKEVMALLKRDDFYIRQLDSGKFIVTAPHPDEDIEYVLCTWENQKAPREFIDLGRCVNCALKMGADSIRFKLLPETSAGVRN
jgi:hypothetical protein